MGTYCIASGRAARPGAVPRSVTMCMMLFRIPSRSSGGARDDIVVVVATTFLLACFFSSITCTRVERVGEWERCSRCGRCIFEDDDAEQQPHPPRRQFGGGRRLTRTVTLDHVDGDNKHFDADKHLPRCSACTGRGGGLSHLQREVIILYLHSGAYTFGCVQYLPSLISMGLFRRAVDIQ